MVLGKAKKKKISQFFNMAQDASSGEPQKDTLLNEEASASHCNAKLASVCHHICTSMMLHWLEYKKEWKKFAQMTCQDVHMAFQHTSLGAHFATKFQNMDGDSVAFFTVCDPGNQERLLSHYFGIKNVRQAQTMLWFFLTLDTWRFNIPNLLQFCNDDEETALHIQKTLKSSYNTINDVLITLGEVPTFERTRPVSTTTSIHAFDMISQYLQPCVITAYIHNIMERAIMSNDPGCVLSTFPHDWAVIKDSGILDTDDVAIVESLVSWFNRLTQ